MKKIIIVIFLSLFMISGCNNKVEETSINNKEINNNSSDEVINIMKVSINNKDYIINLEDNDTVKEFVNLLPLKLSMKELNGNEKYVYLDTSLSSKPTNIKQINKGDVMLFGDDCLVIFYKSFTTSYSYTKIGHIDNLDGLGNGDIVAYFEY